MKAITSNGITDSKKDLLVLVFEDDDDLNELTHRLALTDVKTSGQRIVTLVPKCKLTPLQDALINAINGLDGFGSSDDKKHQAIVDNGIKSINEILTFFEK